MTLHQRIMLGIGVTVACLVGLVFAASQFIILKNYQMLEQQDATLNVQRIVHELQNNIDTIKLTEINWTGRPVPRPIPPYQGQEMFDPHLIEKISLNTRSNITLLFDPQKNVIFQRVRDTNTGVTMPTPANLLTTVKSSPFLVNNPDSETVVKGILSLPNGPLMTLSMPTPLPSLDNSNRQYGRIVWGRYIDDAEIKHLADESQVDIQLLVYNEQTAPVDFQRAKVNLGNDSTIYFEPLNSHILSGYTSINDIFGKPTLMLRMQIPRTIYLQGLDSVSSFEFVGVLGILALAAAAYIVLKREILSPIQRLSADVSHTESKCDDKEIVISGTNEIHNLTARMRELVRSREETQLKLQAALNTIEIQVTERTSTLLATNAVLQQQVNETKQTQHSLIEARDKALEALQMRSQLLANVSHDTRTPLTIISLNTEMLQQGRHGHLNAKQNEVLDRILIATRQLIGFVTTILGEAQLTNGKMPLVKVTFEPKLLIEDLVSMLKPLADGKGIQLKSEIDLAVPSELCGDPDRLKQILTNLCENAIKFTRDGSVTLIAHRKDQHQWIIQVKDTGRGIPVEAQSRIFEAYWQLNSTQTSDANKGVGLGLSIVKQIVELMNGTIAVESEPEKGTTFTVTLPIEQEQQTSIGDSFRPPKKLVI